MTTATAGAGTNETTQFTTGAQVSCKSGPCGKLTRVIIDPVKRTLTHLVVEPRHGETGRLVPLKLVDHSSPDQIDLACTQQEFDALVNGSPLPGFEGLGCGGDGAIRELRSR